MNAESLTPSVKPAPVRLVTVREARLRARLQALAAAAYRLEQDFLGVSNPEPFSTLPAPAIERYIRRARLMVAGGVGATQSAALTRTVSAIVLAYEVWTSHSPKQAKEIEEMLAAVVDQFETQLDTSWMERSR